MGDKPIGGDVKTRLLELTDLDAALALQSACWDSVWWDNATTVARSIETGDTIGLFDGHELVGTATISADGTLYAVEVHPRYQRAGHGTVLATAAVQMARARRPASGNWRGGISSRARR